MVPRPSLGGYYICSQPYTWDLYCTHSYICNLQLCKQNALFFKGTSIELIEYRFVEDDQVNDTVKR